VLQGTPCTYHCMGIQLPNTSTGPESSCRYDIPHFRIYPELLDRTSDILVMLLIHGWSDPTR
jgi:hypothetical protein